MPPKAARGAGRGRGRGRGKATAAAAPAAESSTPAPGIGHGQAADEQNSQSTIAAPSPEAPAPAISTPQLSEDSFSPNSSPATVPTETPAPTPARAAPTSQPELDASSTSTRSAAAPSTRGGRGGARGGPKAPSKFKPKAVRSDATKLAELAKKEQERLDGIAAAKAREEGRLMRGRGRPARGRGDVMGRTAGSRGGAGLFGALPESIKKAPTGFLRSGGGGPGANSVAGIKTETGGPSGSGGGSGGWGGSGGGGGGGGGSRGSGNGYIPEPHYPGEDQDTPRVNIELINLDSDLEDDVQVIGSRKVRSSGMRPVRLDRHEHQARVTIVNTGPNIKPPPEDDDKIEVDETRSSRPGLKEDVTKGDPGDEIQIKTEPDIPVAFRTTSPGPSRQVEPISPQSKRKVKGQAASIAVGVDDDDVTMSGVAEEKKTRRLSKKRDNKPVLQTEEDRAEYERHLEDIRVLAEELGGMQGNLNDKGKGKDVDGDHQMDGTAPTKPEGADRRAGRLYLFQFPPVLPELYDPAKGKPTTEVDPKPNATNEKDADGDIEITGTDPSTVKGKGKLKDRVDLIGEPSAPIKLEEEAILVDKAKKEEEKKRAPYVHEEGHIGKLIVRESGRVELSWGGVNLLVGRGVDAGFLTTGVVVDSVERGPPGGGAPEGRALSMGQIMGKFVVTPDWEHMA